MRKKIIGIVLVVIAIIVGCITYKVYANSLQKEKENLQLTIAENNVKIDQINLIQTNLHETADAIRCFNIEDTLINELSNKWLEYNETKNLLISDNEKFTLQINEIDKKVKESENSKTYLGDFTLVAYYQGNKTSTGTRPRANHTIAVDPTVIPYGSKVYIEGYGTYIAEDCGGGIKGNMIDIYMNTYNECIQFGRRKAKVYIVK